MEAVADHPQSESVNKPETIPFRVQDNQDTFGLDDIKLTNPIDNVGGHGNGYSLHEHNVEEEDSFNDAFDNDDPFNHVCDDDFYDNQDPFDCVYYGLFDPYFGVFVELLRRASVAKKHGTWVIRSYVKDHSCSNDARFRRNRGTATSEVIAQMVKDDNSSPGNIAKMLEKVYDMKITYWKVWKAKEIVTQLIRGNPEASCHLTCGCWRIQIPIHIRHISLT
ncbi:hypothetical protein LIER_14912 [Lithospermum erythrorhizon]|uniref:Uncharacterized protein n=1 Tax=Lithospermum erythrorhizon TaxID=34254 RepID=A0AAV3Q4Y7_LITER